MSKEAPVTTEDSQASEPEVVETQGQSETPETSVEPTGHKSRAERRINKLTARLAAEREEKEALRKRLDEISQKVETLSNPAPTKPQRDQFESDEEFTEALVEYRVSERMGAQTPKATPQPDPGLAQRSNEFIESAEDTVKGFRKIVQNANFPLTEHSWSEIMDMENDGPKVFVHLNDHPQEAMRIAQLSPREQTVELEKLADSLDKKSSAPPPISPVSGNDNPEVDETKLSTEEWIARRNKKVYGY